MQEGEIFGVKSAEGVLGRSEEALQGDQRIRRNQTGPCYTPFARQTTLVAFSTANHIQTASDDLQGDAREVSYVHSRADCACLIQHSQGSIEISQDKHSYSDVSASATQLRRTRFFLRRALSVEQFLTGHTPGADFGDFQVCPQD